MPKKILLIKTTSLGDVVHALPAVSDARANTSLERVDWVVEHSYAPIVRMHRGVNDVIEVSIRQWRKRLWQSATQREIRSFWRRLRESNYDAIIDAQGLFKSAVIAGAAHGPRYGLDFHSSREPLAWFYDQAFRVPWTLNAVERNKSLLAQALNYEASARCDYGIGAQPRRFEWLATHRYVVFLHATSDDKKLWGVDNWSELGAALNARDLACVLPWGSARERERSLEVAQPLRVAIVPPALPVEQLAQLFVGAQAVIGVDTGLTHLAAALGVPTIGIYTATDPAATGIFGCVRSSNLGSIHAPPSVSAVFDEFEELSP